MEMFPEITVVFTGRSGKPGFKIYFATGGRMKTTNQKPKQKKLCYSNQTSKHLCHHRGGASIAGVFL